MAAKEKEIEFENSEEENDLDDFFEMLDSDVFNWEELEKEKNENDSNEEDDDWLDFDEDSEDEKNKEKKIEDSYEDDEVKNNEENGEDNDDDEDEEIEEEDYFLDDDEEDEEKEEKGGIEEEDSVYKEKKIDQNKGEIIDWSTFLSNLNKTKKVVENYINYFDEEELDKRSALVNFFNEISSNRYEFLTQTAAYDLKDYYLEDLNLDKVNIIKFPFWVKVDLWKISINEEWYDEKVVNSSLAIATWMKPSEVKSWFLYKWNYYLLNKKFFSSYDDQYFIKLLTKLNWYHWYNDDLTIVLWYDLLQRKLLFSDYPTLRHYLVLWTTWSWKTVFMISIVIQYLIKHNVEMLFVEKWADLNNFYKMVWDWFFYKNNVFSINVEWIYALFIYLTLELKRRERLFRKQKVSDIFQYNDSVEEKDKLKFILFVIDEFSVLRETLKSMSKEADEVFIATLTKLLRVFRSFWIYTMIATQDALTDSVPTQIQNNLNTKAIWFLQWASRYNWIWDLDLKRESWKWTFKKWDFIIQSEDFTTTVVRWFYLPDKDINYLIKMWYLEWKKEEELEQISKMWVENYSEYVLWQKIEKLLIELNIDIFKTEKFPAYWVNMQKFNQLLITNKVAITILFNLIIN